MGKNINELVANYFGALSYPIRLEILELLKNKEGLCVCDIVSLLKKEQSGISRHLNVLREEGILEQEKEGVRTYYKIKDKRVFLILDLVKTIIKKQVEETQKIFQ